MIIKPEELDIPMDFQVPAHEALVNVWWTGTLLKRVARRFFKSTAFSEAEFNLVMSLKYSDEPLTQNAIARRLLVDKSNVTVLIDRLEQRSIIRRNRVAEDRRRYHISLTDTGRRLIDEVDPAYHAMIERIMAGLDTDEYETMIRLNRRLREGLLSPFPTGA